MGTIKFTYGSHHIKKIRYSVYALCRAICACVFYVYLKCLTPQQSGSICVNLGGPVVQVVQLNGYMSIGLCILAHIVFRRPLPKHPERKTQKTTTTTTTTAITTIIITRATTKQTVTTTFFSYMPHTRRIQPPFWCDNKGLNKRTIHCININKFDGYIRQFVCNLVKVFGCKDDGMCGVIVL
uniref:Uncharacterized protein n=1 Tax=Glossina palpalis gambiensis TaxID=67801 RepID=A0A1B0BKD9_9MUSC